MNTAPDLFAPGTEPGVFEVTVFGSAKPAGSKRAFVFKDRKSGKHRASVSDANPDSKDWKFSVAQACGVAMTAMGIEMFGKVPLEATFKVYRMRPTGHSGKRGLLASAPDYPITRPDLLKLARGIEDAMSKVVYVDDSHIVREVLEKHYGTPERVEIMVREMPKVER